jgi:hypothetical protein
MAFPLHYVIQSPPLPFFKTMGISFYNFKLAPKIEILMFWKKSNLYVFVNTNAYVHYPDFGYHIF